jgi:glutamine phosphoribosylpyrophosphate amidotransferase
MFDTLKEECGVFGMFSNESIDIAQYAYYALFALQHRGQESAGIVVNDDGIMNLHKNVGWSTRFSHPKRWLHSVKAISPSVMSGTEPPAHVRA